MSLRDEFRAAFEEIIVPELQALRVDLRQIRHELWLTRRELRSMRIVPFPDREARCRPRRRGRRTDGC